MLKVISLCKNFGNFSALKNVNFEIPSSTITVFLGVNGAGKTTTMKIISGLLKQDSGEVFIDGKNINNDPIYCKRITGYVPDRAFFYEKLSCREFLKFIARIYDIPSNLIDEKIQALLSHYQIIDKIDTLIEGLSHGMRQRLALCAGLINSPKLLIVDEPMVGLDPYGAKLLKDSLREYAQNGMGIFVSTHSLEVAQDIADNILIIDKGEIIQNLTIKELNESKEYKNIEELFMNTTSNAFDNENLNHD